MPYITGDNPTLKPHNLRYTHCIQDLYACDQLGTLKQASIQQQHSSYAETADTREGKFTHALLERTK